MNGKVSDEAILSVARVLSGHFASIEEAMAYAEASIEAALPHLQTAKPEAVRMRDELRERAEFEAWADSGGFDITKFKGIYNALATRSAWEAWHYLAATGNQQAGDIPTMDSGLAAWLSARGLMPDADEDGCVEMDDVIAALNEHERQLAPGQQVGESCTHEWRTAGGGSQARRPLVCSKCNQHRDHMPQQVGEVQDSYEDAHKIWKDREDEADARQPVGQEPVDIEAALIAGDPNWQEQCRPNLRGNERLFFAVRDIAEMRAMLAGEKKPLPGSGLAVVRVNPNAPSLVPYQCAHRLLGDAYQAGEQGTGYCDQAEELFVARTAHAKKESVAVVYAAPPAQAVDLSAAQEDLQKALDYLGRKVSPGMSPARVRIRSAMELIGQAVQ